MYAVKIVKNKIAPPFREAEFDIMFGKGISREGDILDMAVTLDIIKKSGAWYAYNGEKIGQGRENAKIFLTEHPDIRDTVEGMIRRHYGLDGAAEDGVDAAGTEGVVGTPGASDAGASDSARSASGTRATAAAARPTAAAGGPQAIARAQAAAAKAQEAAGAQG